ncbi:MAG: hypothetical protein ACK4SU_02790, partial [Dictyoglomus sp.]
TTNVTGIITYNLSKNVTLKGTIRNSTVNGTSSTDAKVEATLTPIDKLTIYGKIYQPFNGGKTELYANLSSTYINNLNLYTAIYYGNGSYLYLNTLYNLYKNLNLRGIYQLLNDGSTTHSTYYLALELNNASLYFGKAPDAEGTSTDFVKQIGAKISFDF